jgi:hypothetical protein
MNTPRVDLEQRYTVGGTTTENFTQKDYKLSQSETYITIQDTSLFSRVIFRDAPSTRQIAKRKKVQPAVKDSLERSIKEHADVWAELSKY